MNLFALYCHQITGISAFYLILVNFDLHSAPHVCIQYQLLCLSFLADCDDIFLLLVCVY